MLNKRGFTIIELMIAMSFLSVLLISITIVTIQVGKTYSRGMTMHQLNQSGRTLMDAIRRDFLQANTRSIVNAEQPVVSILGADGSTVVGGRICLGGVSYVWNLAKAIDNKIVGDGVTVFDQGEGSRTVNMVRVEDEGGRLCKANATGKYQSQIDRSKATELLREPGSDDAVLAVHKLDTIRVTNIDNRESLYKVTFTLGTNTLSELTSAGRCLEPSNIDANPEFCAINNFQMIVRTNG